MDIPEKDRDRDEKNREREREWKNATIPPLFSVPGSSSFGGLVFMQALEIYETL